MLHAKGHGGIKVGLHCGERLARCGGHQVEAHREARR
jgi:hypothetical protein